MARKASTDKPISNLEAEFNETSTANTPYPATNSGYLNNEKTNDVLNYYAISLGIGGYANLLRNVSGAYRVSDIRQLRVSDIRQLHANFLGWLVSNNVVTVNDDMVNYIKAYLSTFNNSSVV